MTKRRKPAVRQSSEVQLKPAGTRALVAPRPDDYPLELLAKTAALLFKGDHRDAARNASLLLDACEEESSRQWIEIRKRELFGPEHSIPFDEAVMRMTGYKDLENAANKYRDALRKAIAYLFEVVDESTARSKSEEDIAEVDLDESLRDVMKSQRKFGIPEILLLAFQSYFELTKQSKKSNRRGSLTGVSKKNPKNS